MCRFLDKQARAPKDKIIEHMEGNGDGNPPSFVEGGNIYKETEISSRTGTGGKTRFKTSIPIFYFFKIFKITLR